MAVGQGVNILSDSYLIGAPETTFGTYVTGTAALDFISSSIKMVQESKTIEEIQRSRTMSKSIRMGRKVEGDLEYYFYPQNTLSCFILQNALGGTVTSATATGESAGAALPAYTHTFNIGNMDNSRKSLSLDHRKGDSATGQRFAYTGLRVNEFNISAEIDDALKVKVSLIGVDASATSTDLSAVATFTSYSPLSFEGGRFSVESVFASLTSSSFWHVQNINLTVTNNLKSDNESRRIGSDLLSVLPVGVANFNLSVTMRFDTLTAWNAMINDTTLFAEFQFLGPTATGSKIAEGVKFIFPKLKVTDAGEPEISGADGILTSEVQFQVLRDDTSATGYAMKVELTNYAASI